MLLVAAVLVAGGALLLSDSPAKTLESFAIRHADKLPLAYLGGKLFDKHCASCHDNPAMHAPTREALSGFSKETVMVALEFGKMQPMATHLSKQERGLIAIYLAGTAPPDEWIAEQLCDRPCRRQDALSMWPTGGWATHNRTIRASRSTPGSIAATRASLTLAWSLAFPRGNRYAVPACHRGRHPLLRRQDRQAVRHRPAYAAASAATQKSSAAFVRPLPWPH